MSSLLIVNAQLVNEGSISDADVLIRHGRIEAIGHGLSASAPDVDVLDAQGRYLLPGMIDAHMSMPDARSEDAANTVTESSAAVAGGITSFMGVPDATVQTASISDIETLNEQKQRAAGRSLANFAFYMGATTNNLDVIKKLKPKDACGVHVFMGGATGNALVDDPEVLEQIFKHAPVLIAAHCEDTPTVLEHEESYRGIYGDDIPFYLHPTIRSEAACYTSSSMALELAKRCEAALHVLHVSTAKEAEMFAAAALADKLITAEVGMPFLHFADGDYAEQGGNIKQNPAIKTAADRAGLIQGLLDGHLDMIGTGHVPHMLADKQHTNYFKVPAGFPLADYALPMVLEHFQDGIFTLEFIAEKISHAVAERFAIKERGYIREGYWADLVLVDTAKPFTATHESTLSQAAWTPFNGYEFRSSVAATIVNGTVVWHEGQLVNTPPKGVALEFER